MHDPLAVIFDVDGVLVDSYHAHFRSWQLLLAEYGLEMTEQQFAETFGRTTREIIRQSVGEEGFSERQVALMDDRKEALYREIIARDFREMDGASDLVAALHDAGFAMAVGSSGPPENVELVLERLTSGHLFGATVTGTDVTRGKPDPQVFLLAAERLRRPPACCAVIEDAQPGIAAARAADMVGIGLVSTGRTAEELENAHLTVRSLRELTPAIIRQLIIGRRHASENG